MAVARGDTVVQEAPPTEPGPAPVEQHVSQRQLFGVAPSSVLLLALAVVGVILAIVLLATGNWPWALIALGIGLFLFTGFRAQTRRPPDDGSALRPAPRPARSRAFEPEPAPPGRRSPLTAARGSSWPGSGETSPLSQRSGASECGRWARPSTPRTTAPQRIRKLDIKEIDDEIASKEGQMAQVTMDAMDRIGRAKMQVQPTRVLPGGVELPDQPDPAQPPEPAQVPEPEPAQVPEPAPTPVPEPYPPPDEGERPKPPEIPEPSPTTDSRLARTRLRPKNQLKSSGFCTGEGRHALSRTPQPMPRRLALAFFVCLVVLLPAALLDARSRRSHPVAAVQDRRCAVPGGAPAVRHRLDRGQDPNAREPGRRGVDEARRTGARSQAPAGAR